MHDGSGLTDEDAGGKDQATPNDDLQAGERKAGLEVAMADKGDDHQFDTDDAVGPGESGVDIRNKKRQRVKKAADEGHQTCDNAAKDGIAATGQLAVVGEPFREGHRDTRANRGGRADEEDRSRVVSRKSGSEDGRERGDRAVHETGKTGLHDAQNEVFVVSNQFVEFG